jgi:hypothetical protein
MFETGYQEIASSQSLSSATNACEAHEQWETDKQQEISRRHLLKLMKAG